jgi:hypothetical protein
MISTFVLLLHMPGVVSAPGSRLHWTILFVATALAGSAWALAESLRAESWGWTRTSQAIRVAAAN